MAHRIACTLMTAGLIAGLAIAQAPAAKPAAANAAKIRRTADGHPDLSGMWEYAIDRAPASLKKVVNGKEVLVEIDQSARHRVADNMPGSLPWTKAPSYKPEHLEKVKYNLEHESKVDGVFYCGKPGVPRIGSPRRIVQLKDEFIFLYEDISGDPYRVIPVVASKADVAKKHNADGNPSFYGDAVAYWDGDTLVVESINFVDESWFGEGGYFHSDALKVTERIWRVGENLGYQVTVEDPKVLTAAWTNFPHLVRPSTTPLEESPACKEDDAHRLLNLDNHLQR
jgi:hypothetical protein